MTTIACLTVAGRWLACLPAGVRSSAVCLGLLLGAVAVDAKEPVAIFHVGNSLTVQVFQEDPHDCIISGLRFWKAPYSVDKAFAQVVWDVVAEVTKAPPTK